MTAGAFKVYTGDDLKNFKQALVQAKNGFRDPSEVMPDFSSSDESEAEAEAEPADDAMDVTVPTQYAKEEKSETSKILSKTTTEVIQTTTERRNIQYTIADGMCHMSKLEC